MGGFERPRIVVDASNVCAGARDARGHPKLSNLMVLHAALAKLGLDVTIMCDANLKYEIDSPEELQALISRGEILQVPAGTDADVYILDAAARLGARVLSNDLFRQHVKRFPWIAERRVRYMLMADQVLIPDLAVGAARPLCGVEESIDSSESAPVTLTTEPDRRQSLVQGLIDENEALRSQRAQLLAECENLRAQLSTQAASAAMAEQASAADRSAVRSLDAKYAEAAADFAHARSQLASEREQLASLLVERSRLEQRVSELEQHELVAAARVSTLEKALAATRPDALLERKVESLMREAVRTLKSQAEPIKRTLEQATETHKAVAAMRADTRSLAQHAEAISTSLARRTEVESPEHDAPSDADGWSTRYPRIERAWMAKQVVGDQVEAAAFLKSVEALRAVEPSLDDDRLLEDVDSVRERVGENFSYAALWKALRGMHKPSLQGGYLLTATRAAVKTLAAHPTSRTGTGA